MTTTIPNALFLLPSRSLSPRVNSLCFLRVAEDRSAENPHAFGLGSCRLGWSRRRSGWGFWIRAASDCSESGGGERADGGGGRVELDTRFRALQGVVDSLPPAVLVVKRNVGSKFAIGSYIAFALLVIVVRKIMPKKKIHNPNGSVADLVKRGQLRSDRRGISKPLQYEDPFNNPLVKLGKSNSTVEICGKVYRLAPVTLTEEQQSIHQKRRSRVYQWKRPTVFLKEGDKVPPDVDPDTIRWIPANHPFATTVSDIDEDLAQKNVFQKDGVPFRVKAEHEALQKKLEKLQSEDKLNKVAISPKNILDLQSSVKSSSQSHTQPDSSPAGTQQYGYIASNPNQDVDSSELKN